MFVTFCSQVTLQYVCPMILILFMTFIYKTMGDSGSWMFGSPQNGTLSEEISAATERPVLKLEIEPLNVRREEMEAKIDVVTGQFSLAWQSLKHVFTPAVFRYAHGQHFQSTTCREGTIFIHPTPQRSEEAPGALRNL